MDQDHLLSRLAAALPEMITKTKNEKGPEQSKDVTTGSVLPCALLHNSGEVYWDAANEYLRRHESALKTQPNTLPELYPSVLDEAGEVAYARDLLSSIMRALEFDRHMHDKVAALSQLDVNFLRVDLATHYMSEDGGIVMLMDFKQARSIGTGNVEAKLVKQAKTYAIATGCLYIALCDYESLVLLKFDEDLSIVKVAVVDKEARTFRKALFGFLLYAIKHRNEVHR